KVWIPEGDRAALEAVTAFNVSPIPLSIAEVRTALQTGLIDTVATSPIGAIALQWHTQISYLLNVPLMYIYGMLAVDLKTFKKLSPDDQEVVRSVMGRVFREMDRQNRAQNANAMDALKNQGIEFLTPSPETLQELYARGAKVSKRLIETGKFSSPLIKALDTHLKDYRSGRAKQDD
ncbi:TRAP transporter substrate-binding protein DctP, partial [Thermodesulfobacteriota bacterium]